MEWTRPVRLFSVWHCTNDTDLKCWKPATADNPNVP